MEFNVRAARKFARDGRIEEWIHTYLANKAWINLGLSEGLKKQKRYWVGPLEVDLTDLSRCCGPEDDMEYRMELEHWKTRTTGFAANLNDPMDLPPLLVQYLPHKLDLRDGNHRHEALRLKGFPKAWILLWYKSEEEMKKDVLKRCP
jgi:hypothetical protein